MPDLDDLWHQYKTTSDPALRDQLIVHYTDLVRYVASRVATGLPQSVELADLASYGTFGLIDAIDKFDPGRGYKFETYAIARIKGAILDELRSIDWVPRSVRAKARAIEKAHTKLEGELHRTPTPTELAHELDLTPTQLHTMVGQVSFVGIAALDDTVGWTATKTGKTPTLGDDTPYTLGDTIIDAGGLGDTIEIEELRTVLGHAANDMPERENIVLTLYYHHGLTLAEIGQVLGVTESRVCQIHTKAIHVLRVHVLAQEPVT